MALMLAGNIQLSSAQKVWKGTWATAVEYTGQGDMPKESLSNRSCRQIVHVSFGGNVLRLKLSNEQSKEPVEIKSVYLADTDDDCNWFVKGKTVKYLTFNGRKNVSIGPGKSLYSDVAKYHLKAVPHNHHRLWQANTRTCDFSSWFSYYFLYSQWFASHGETYG